MSNAVVEGWTLYAVGVASTILRFYARMRVDGLRSLMAEDYLMAISIAFYTIQTTLAYNIGILAHGLANNGISDAQRVALSPSDPEYDFSVLQTGLGRPYRIRIYVGFGLVIGTFIATMITIFAGCQPFHKYWQINPDPGNSCQAAISKPIVWVSFAANISTDIYLIAIPLPMLWGSSLKMIKKIASTIVLGAGIFVLVCATLKSVFVLIDPVHGAELAGAWGTREAFVAVMTTNLPILFPLFRVWLTPIFGSVLRSSHKTSYQYPSGFQTIGGGGRSGKSNDPSRRGPPTANPISANMSFNNSEEQIVKAEAHRMNDLTDYSGNTSKGIIVSNVVEVIHEDKKGGSSRRRDGSEGSW
ncbi:integral membrane protein PTH11 [Fusarium beomiforme]|uniref:Integral membrane protein PTH11 n=1 Tax=Fusarium beomiforme TaxID=44412 RepID=A0A9P5AU78_9HYPO|nr:integral membrane protein PTH11 [Fusarium beomiforme]